MFRTAMAMVTLMLSGCMETTQPATYIYRDGTSVAEADRDHFDCDVKAAQAVPTNTQIETMPSYTTPLRTSCNTRYGSTNCTTTGGDVIGGQTFSYDANEDLRREVWARCMGDRGYTGISIAACDSTRLPAGAIGGIGNRLRAPREGACHVQITDRIGNVVYAPEG